MSRRLTSAGRRLLALVALTLAATMTATTAAFGLAVPTVSTPKVGLPAQPQVPQAPSLPALPAPQAPAVPLPKSPAPLPALPSAGGHGTPAPARPGSAPQSVADAVAANGVALAPRSPGAAGPSRGGTDSAGRTVATTPQRRAAARRGARERRFRRSVRRLSGCIGALPGLERRVLVLRAGLEGRRPHSRGFTARRLGISLRRTAAAERGGLRRLRRVERSSGCAAPAGTGTGAATRDRALAGAPILAGLLGPAIAPGAAPAAPRDASGVSPSSASSPPQAAGAGAPARPTAAADADSPGLPLLLLTLAAAALLALALRPGWRVANGALAERAERSTDRRQAELVAEVHGILGERYR
jgi:hypothetical protein